MSMIGALVTNLNNMGFYNFVLPWILFLAIIFILLKKVPGLKETPENIKALIAVVIAFFIINYTGPRMNLGTYFTNLFGSMAIYLAGGLVILLFLGLTGLDVKNLVGGRVLGILIVIFGMIIFNNIGGTPFFGLSSEMWTLLAVLLLMAGAVLFLGSTEGSEEEKKKKAIAGGTQV